MHDFAVLDRHSFFFSARLQSSRLNYKRKKCCSGRWRHLTHANWTFSNITAIFRWIDSRVFQLLRANAWPISDGKRHELPFRRVMEPIENSIVGSGHFDSITFKSIANNFQFQWVNLICWRADVQHSHICIQRMNLQLVRRNKPVSKLNIEVETIKAICAQFMRSEQNIFT